jgi:ketosteroid isomerase-like protein
MDPTKVIREKNIQSARNLLSFLEQRQLQDFTDLFAEDGKWTHPYHSGLFPPVTQGKKAIFENISKAASNFTEIHFPIDEILPFHDPNKVAIKFTGNLLLKNGKGTYQNDYLAILTFNNQGKITEWTEYYNPIKSAKAFGLMDKIK